MRLSGIIIAKNEAEMLGACLDSLSFCDEVIVVDSGSTDETVDIARAKGATVIERHWPGFGPQKEFARTQAAGVWVLSLDADERVPSALRAEIETVISDDGPDVYDMPFLSTFLGRPMRYSGWWPDRHSRLFRREKARFSEDPVHEGLVFEGPVGHLENHMDHHPIRSLQDAMRRMELYSTLGAGKLIDAGTHVGFFSGILRGSFAFAKTYLLKFGFLDGREGFLNAVVHSQTVFWKYMKAWSLLRRR